MGQRTLRDISVHWFRTKKQFVKRGTLAIYRLQYLKYIDPIFGEYTNTPPEQDVQSFVLECLSDKGLSLKTTQDIMVLLKMMLRFARKHYQWDYPEYEIKYPPSAVSGKKLEVLPKSAQKTIIDYVQNNFTFRNLGIYLCLVTGMRIGEICALKWEDIDIDEGVVNITRSLQRIYVIDENGNSSTEIIESTPKTRNSLRQIPLSRDVRRMLKPLSKVLTPTHYVLTNEKKPTEPRTYRMYYRQLMKELDLPQIKFHGLRHTFATRCVASGADIKTVSALLGHANISTTLNIYVHPTIDDKRNVIDKVFKV